MFLGWNWKSDTVIIETETPWKVAENVDGPFTTTSWVPAPPSDHETNSYGVEESDCGDGAVMDGVDPTITVWVNGVAWVVEPTPSCNPGGFEVIVTSAVSGESRTVVDTGRPPESVAVSTRSRKTGSS